MNIIGILEQLKCLKSKMSAVTYYRAPKKFDAISCISELINGIYESMEIKPEVRPSWKTHIGPNESAIFNDFSRNFSDLSDSDQDILLIQMIDEGRYETAKQFEEFEYFSRVDRNEDRTLAERVAEDEVDKKCGMETAH